MDDSAVRFILPVRSLTLDAQVIGTVRVEVGDSVFSSFKFDVPKQDVDDYPIGSLVELVVTPEARR
jgi:hypothetical protein